MQQRIRNPRRALRRFAELLDRSEALGIRRLPFGDLRELAGLYRLHAARLSRLRERRDDPDQIRYLNALCVRAYTLLYGASSRRWRVRGSSRWLVDALARTWRAQAAAWMLLLMGTFMGAALAARDTQALISLLPASMGYSGVRLDELANSPEARELFLERDAASVSEMAFFGSALFAHNTRIGLAAFATGMLAGLPTTILALYNGLTLGAFCIPFLTSNVWLEFLAWILPHAVPELTAICLCVAAGLLTGAAVAVPGRRTRSQALREALDPALVLFATAIPFFLIAAIVESFVRESTVGDAFRLGVAAALLALVVSMLFGVRALSRRSERRDLSWLDPVNGPHRSESPDSG